MTWEGGLGNELALRTELMTDQYAASPQISFA